MTTTGTERQRAPRGSKLPEAIADLPVRSKTAFEADYKLATQPGSPWREQTLRAGRGYIALGWRIYRDATNGKSRRRKGLGERRDTTEAEIERLRALLKAHGIEDDR